MIIENWENSEGMLSNVDKKRSEALAARVGVSIPGDISLFQWHLPILEKLVERVENLEKNVPKQARSAGRGRPRKDVGVRAGGDRVHTEEGLLD